MPAKPTITELHVYPVKSCRGIALAQSPLVETGFLRDREWLIVRPNGQFITQRDEARLALISVTLSDEALLLSAPGAGVVSVPLQQRGSEVSVICWRDTCKAFDEGEGAARWLSAFLGTPLRLVRFDPSHKRLSDLRWTGGVEALNQFVDGYPLLVLSQASLDDLNRRLAEPVPMNRFRPNIVIDGVPAYGEDDLAELHAGEVKLRLVKPCTRCMLTTIEQSLGRKTGAEPLKTLSQYRYDRELKGVLFGQNAIIAAGVGGRLSVGQGLTAFRRPVENTNDT